MHKQKQLLRKLCAHLQVVDLPEGRHGLAWIAGRLNSQLLLIPGIKPASIAAAAARNKDALAYPRFAAQQFAAVGSNLRITFFDKLCLDASSITDGQELTRFLGLPRHAAECEEAYRKRMCSTAELLDAAVAQGHLDALKWLRALCHRFCSEISELVQAAAEQGHLSILKYLRTGSHPAPWCRDVTESAAPHIDCLLWLIPQTPACPCHVDIVATTASSGDLDALVRRRAASKLPPNWGNAEVCKEAARSGNLGLLQFLRSLDLPVTWDSGVCAQAAMAGNISMLQWAWAQEQPCPWGVDVAAAAAKEGNLQTLLEWLCSRHPPCLLGTECCKMGAKTGQLEALKSFRSRQPPCPWDEGSMRFAAGQPDSSIVQWMRSQEPPCPWNLGITNMAASQGDLPMFIWLRAQDPPCPLSPTIGVHAAGLGHLPMLEWVHLHEHQPDLWDGDSYFAAALGGHVRVLKWLHARGVPAPHKVFNPVPMYTFNSLGNAKTPVPMFLGDVGHPPCKRTWCKPGEFFAPSMACYGGANVPSQILAGASIGPLMSCRLLPMASSSWCICPCCRLRLSAALLLLLNFSMTSSSAAACSALSMLGSRFHLLHSDVSFYLG